METNEGYEKLAAIGIAYKGDYNPHMVYEKLNAVCYDGAVYVALKNSPTGHPEAYNVSWQYLPEGLLSLITAIDTSALLGTEGATVGAQTLIDAITDQIKTKLLPKTDVISQIINDPNKAASAAALFAVDQKVTSGNETAKELPNVMDREFVTLFDSSLDGESPISGPRTIPATEDVTSFESIVFECPSVDNATSSILQFAYIELHNIRENKETVYDGKNIADQEYIGSAYCDTSGYCGAVVDFPNKNTIRIKSVESYPSWSTSVSKIYGVRKRSSIERSYNRELQSVIVEGTVTGGETVISYPEGYDRDHCIIRSFNLVGDYGPLIPYQANVHMWPQLRNSGIVVIDESTGNWNGYKFIIELAKKSSIINKTTYNIEETPVGTWIDGKTIYRIIIPYTQTIANTTKTIFNGSDLNIDQIVNISGTATTQAGSVLSTAYTYGSTIYAIVFNNPSKEVKVVSTNITLVKVTAILEYTKLELETGP